MIHRVTSAVHACKKTRVKSMTNLPIKLSLDLALSLWWAALVLLLKEDKEPPEQPRKLCFCSSHGVFQTHCATIWTWTARITLCSREDFIRTLFCSAHFSMHSLHKHFSHLLCPEQLVQVFNLKFLSTETRLCQGSVHTCSGHYTAIQLLLFWCEMPPLPPVSSVWQCWPFSYSINFP